MTRAASKEQNKPPQRLPSANIDSTGPSTRFPLCNLLNYSHVIQLQLNSWFLSSIFWFEPVSVNNYLGRAFQWTLFPARLFADWIWGSNLLPFTIKSFSNHTVQRATCPPHFNSNWKDSMSENALTTYFCGHWLRQEESLAGTFEGYLVRTYGKFCHQMGWAGDGEWIPGT